MILMLLLTELAHLGVKLSVGQNGLRVQAPVGVLTEEKRRAIKEQKAAFLQFARFPYVETIDGLGMLTGNRQEQDISFIPPEGQEAARYKIGVMLLSDGGERFYWPRMVLVARPERVQTDEPKQEVML